MTRNGPDTPTRQLSRAAIAGAVLAVLGVGLFILLYVLLSDAPDLPRLLVSLCVPPAVMAVIVGGYLLATARHTSED